MINLTKQLAIMTCIKYINQKKIELNDTYRNYINNVTITTQQNDWDQSLKLKNWIFKERKNLKNQYSQNTDRKRLKW